MRGGYTVSAALAGIVPGQTCSIPEAAEPVQRDGASFDAAPATVCAGSRPTPLPSELQAGSFTNHINTATRKNAQTFSIDCPDDAGVEAPSAVARGEDSPFIRMLRSIKDDGIN